MKLNMNATCRVTLTQEGQRHLRHEYRAEPKWAPKPEADGRYKMLLWELFSTFGEKCTMGSSPMFVDNEIEIATDGKL